jgi:hypothetical protein
VVSAFDELIVGLDATVLIEDEDLQAGGRPFRCPECGEPITT